MIRHGLAILLWVAAAAPAVAAPYSDAELARRFDELAARARIDWKVPGLAVALLRDGRPILVAGYGVRNAGGSVPVDGDTLFAVGSTTKAMTTLALGTLVDEGKLAWDDPVRRFVPELTLADPGLGEDLTVRDLLTHHSGLPATDYLWFGGEHEWSEILRRLARVRRDGPTRGRFAYQNVLYGLAGDVVGRAAGSTWAEVVRRRIFAPLGMARSAALGADMGVRINVADPHTLEDGPIPRAETMALVDQVPAAGAVWSSAADMARWVGYLLAPDKARLVKTETLAEIFRPQVVVSAAGFYPTQELTRPHWMTYGLGWFQQDYRGEKVDFHTGSIDGMVAIVGLLRDRRAGVVVLANLDHAEVRHALMLSAFDLFLDERGATSRDWNRDLFALYGARRQHAETERLGVEKARVLGTRSSLDAAAYAGRYEDPLYGTVEVTANGSGLTVRVGKTLTGRAEHWHYDVFRVTWERKLYGSSYLIFRLGGDAKVSAVEIDGAVYARRPDPPAKTS